MIDTILLIIVLIPTILLLCYLSTLMYKHFFTYSKNKFELPKYFQHNPNSKIGKRLKKNRIELLKNGDIDDGWW